MTPWLELRKDAQLLRTFIEHCPIEVAMFDRNMNVLVASDRWLQIYGGGRESITGLNHYDLVPDMPEHWKGVHQRCLQGASEKCAQDPWQINGETQWFRWEVHPWRENDGRTGGIIIYNQNITAEKRLEEQLTQSRRLEALGRLAGGIAHDFNNLLTAMLGFAELSARELEPDHAVQDHLLQIEAAAKRAGSLTSQLLAFARKRVVAPSLVCVNRLVLDMIPLVRRVIGENIELIVNSTKHPLYVFIEPTQLEQVVLNLVLNGRDAMPGGGRIELVLGEYEVDSEPQLPSLQLSPGPYVTLSVRDTGCGMTGEVLSHLFEPFFTTKEPGQGTGLGLATSYGIVRQAGGNVIVKSVPGSGTTFVVFLSLADPSKTSPASTRSSEEDRSKVRGGNETILVAEDEPLTRSMIELTLTAHGYVVLMCRDPVEAIEVARAHSGGIDLLLTDVIMPQLSGPQLAQIITSEFPRTRVLYVSGYVEDRMVPNEVIRRGVTFLAKPFTPTSLLEHVRVVIDQTPNPISAGNEPTTGTPS